MKMNFYEDFRTWTKLCIILINKTILIVTKTKAVFANVMTGYIHGWRPVLKGDCTFLRLQTVPKERSLSGMNNINNNLRSNTITWPSEIWIGSLYLQIIKGSNPVNPGID